MLLLIYFLFLFATLKYLGNKSPGVLLLEIYIISLGCALLIGKDVDIDTFAKAWNLLFLAGILTMFIMPWTRFDYRAAIAEPNPRKLRNLTVALVAINGLAFIVFAYICYSALTQISNYTVFKNEGGSTDFVLDLPINHAVYLFAVYMHPTSYFLVPLHFYYLVRHKFAISILCLLLSMNVLLNGLTIFSRSGIALYIFLYLVYGQFFYKRLQVKVRKFVVASGTVLGIMVIAVFSLITMNRFGEYGIYDRLGQDSNFISNPETYSVVDYASQWYRNGSEVMARYSFETLNGQISFPLVLEIANKAKIINYSSDRMESELNSVWGDLYDRFNGIVPNLIFDLGYAGAIIFAMLYAFSLRCLGPTEGNISFSKMLTLGVMFMLPAMGIFGYAMRMATYNAAVLYAVIVYIYMTFDISFRRRRYA